MGGYHWLGDVLASLVLLTSEVVVATRYEQLTALYGPEQLEQMEMIREKLLDDPTALDNRHVADTSTEDAAQKC